MAIIKVQSNSANIQYGDEKVMKRLAEKMVKALDYVLRAEANSNSCLAAFQPKAPEQLKRFKKVRK